MADLRGRCGNLEYCSAAVSQRIIVLPEGSNFVCPKCGEALQPIRFVKARGLSRIGLVLQFGIVLAGAGGVAYKLLGMTVWRTYTAILDACCNAWNSLMKDAERIASITTRTWAQVKT